MSNKFTLPAEEASRLRVLSVGGNLTVKGWEKPEIHLRVEEDESPLRQEADAILVESSGDMLLRMPYDFSLEVLRADGDVLLKNIQGDSHLHEIHGSLRARDLGALQAENLNGDFSGRRIHGDVHLRHVAGSAHARDVDGQFAADVVGGDLRLKEISGGVSAKCGGDAMLTLAPVPWQAYHIEAGGDLLCRFVEDASARLHLESVSGEIRLRLAETSQDLNEGEHDLVLGENEEAPPVHLSAGGVLTVRQWTETPLPPAGMPEDITRQVEEQVLAQLDMVEAQLDAHLSTLGARLSGDPLPEHVRERIERRLEAARERVQRRMQAAQHRHRLRRHRRAVEPVSEDERLMILQMLQAGTITAEQADKLLAALEGNPQ
ncbi:MAG: hypothetical protein D6755_02385 [Anaerolineae bacterium]|nr:MAG: hypothetical protein D6755_02385 [Anaerolineae bacterium]